MSSHITHRSPAPRAALLLACGLAAAAPARAGGENGLTDRVSFASDGSQVTLDVAETRVSADGRYVAYTTVEALLPTDTNGDYDVYVYDREDGDLVCASTTAGGLYGNGDSTGPAISADGRWVAFESSSTNLVGFETNGTTVDVFVKDLQTGSVQRASMATGSVVPGSGASMNPSISDDGNMVAFQTAASDLVPGDTNGAWDIVVRDVAAGTTTLASYDIFGGPANGSSYRPEISGDGTHVAFESAASDMALFDGNGMLDVFNSDLTAGQIGICSQAALGGSGNGDSYRASISVDGSRVVYHSYASDLVAADANGESDVFLWNGSQNALVSATPGGAPGNGGSTFGRISRDGQYAAFRSNASDLTAESSPFQDVYLRDLDAGQTWLVSRSSGLGNIPNDHSNLPDVSEGGDVVAFESDATNLDQGDTNGVRDVFVRVVFDDPQTYCLSMKTSDLCVPAIYSTGMPSAGSNAGFEVGATSVPINKAGMLFYGINGPAQNPFQGGTMCVQGPRKRTPLIDSGPGDGVDPCSGVLARDMNAFAAGLGGGNPAPELSLIGQTVNVQFWGRDPGNAPFHVFLSDALEYVVGL